MAGFTIYGAVCVFLSVSVAILAAAKGDAEAVTKASILDHSVELSCPAPVEAIPKIQWADYVYNSDRKPKVIVDATTGGEINQGHPRHMVYSVDKKMTLKIMNVTIEDAGQYFCRVKYSDGAYTILHKYNLAVISIPRCTGRSSLVTGRNTMLSCAVDFNSNDVPVVEWYSKGMPQSGDEQAGLEIFKVNLPISGVTAANDQQEYTCNVSVAGESQSCKVKLNVKYPVQDIQITPQQESYRVGDVIKCEAKGNPTPNLEWTPKVGGAMRGSGWLSLTIDPSWQGKLQNFQCTASNMVGSETSILSHNITFTPKGAGSGVAPQPEAEPETAEPRHEPKYIEVLDTEAPAAANNNAGAATSSGVPNIGIIIAVAVGAVVIVIIIIVAVCIARKKSEKKKGHMQIPSSDPEEFKKQMDVKGGSPRIRTPKGTDRNSNGYPPYITSTAQDRDPDTPWRRQSDAI